jgi:LysR family transcriptional activator of nhaA
MCNYVPTHALYDLHLRIPIVQLLSSKMSDGTGRGIQGAISCIFDTDGLEKFNLHRAGSIVARLKGHQLDVVLANETVPTTDPDHPLHCRLVGSQSVSLVGPTARWQGRQLRIPEDLAGLDMALPGPRHALRAQFDALCETADVRPRIRAEVDDMAMLRLLARDSGWLALLPEVVVQDELKHGLLCVAGRSEPLREHFYAITAPHRLRPEALDALLNPLR